MGSHLLLWTTTLFLGSSLRLEAPQSREATEAMNTTDGHYRDKPLKILTKGDNNLADDTELYNPGQGFLTREKDIIGSVVGYVPFVGYVTILLSEYPWAKKVMLGLMGAMVVLQRE